MSGEQPRLLDVVSTAAYLGGLSTWTIRAFVADGHLRPVRLPSVRDKNGNGRRLLFDRRDLDDFIEKRRHA
jgi:hypothetical protein